MSSIFQKIKGFLWLLPPLLLVLGGYAYQSSKSSVLKAEQRRVLDLAATAFSEISQQLTWELEREMERISSDSPLTEMLDYSHQALNEVLEHVDRNLEGRLDTLPEQILTAQLLQDWRFELQDSAYVQHFLEQHFKKIDAFWTFQREKDFFKVVLNRNEEKRSLFQKAWKAKMQEALEQSQRYARALPGCTRAQALLLSTAIRQILQRTKVEIALLFADLPPINKEQWDSLRFEIRPQKAYWREGERYRAAFRLVLPLVLDSSQVKTASINGQRLRKNPFRELIQTQGTKTLGLEIALQSIVPDRYELYKYETSYKVIEPAVQLHPLQAQRLYLQQSDTFELIGPWRKDVVLKAEGLELTQLSEYRYALRPHRLGRVKVEAAGTEGQTVFWFEVRE